MTIEEKAKAYDEALERAKEFVSKDNVEAAEYIFPELAESNDGKIRKSIIAIINNYVDNSNTFKSKMLAWLEKQGEKIEQKPTWSEEDEMFVHGLIRGLSAKRDIHGHTTFSSDGIDITETINWLKSLKSRILPQSKQEWSKLDEIRLDEAIQMVESNGRWVRSDDGVKLVADWLKSLKNRYIWRPSDKQIDALHDAAVYVDKSMFPHPKGILMKLYEQLKKLRDE